MSDLVSREDVFEALGITDKSTKYGGDHSGYNTLMLYEIKGAIDSIPTAEPKVGRWKPYLPEYGDMFECSVCEEVARLPYKPMRMPYNYCPNCGAKMERSE